MNNDNDDLKKKRFADYLKSLLKKYSVTQKEFAEMMSVKPQYVCNITSARNTPDATNFDKILNTLKPLAEKTDIYNLINLYDNAKYGKDRTVRTPEDQQQLLPLEKHFLSLFREIKPEGQIKTLESMVAWIEDHKE